MSTTCELCREVFVKGKKQVHRYKTTTVLTPKAVKKVLPDHDDKDIAKSFICSSCVNSFSKSDILKRTSGYTKKYSYATSHVLKR